MICVILGGAIALLLVMFAFGGAASAATDGTLVPSVSADSPVASAQVTVSEDAASVSADSPVASAEASVGGDGTSVSADSLVASAQAVVGGDKAKVSADSPVASVQVTRGGATDSPGLDVSIGPAPSPVGPATPDGGAQLDASQLLTDVDPSIATVQLDLTFGSSMFGQEISEILGEDISGSLPFAPDPANPIAPEGRAGTVPASNSSGEHGPVGIWSWLILSVLFIPLWYLFSARSRMPHGVGDVLALPG